MSKIEPFLTLERSYFLLRPKDYPIPKLKVLYTLVWFKGMYEPSSNLSLGIINTIHMETEDLRPIRSLDHMTNLRSRFE